MKGNGKSLRAGKAAGIFAAVAVAAAAVAGVCVFRFHDNESEASREALKRNMQETRGEESQEARQRRQVEAYVREVFKESDSCLERGEYLQAVQMLMDARQELGDERLAEREAWLRENIVVLEERQYLGGKPLVEYKYDAEGNQEECTTYDRDGNLTGIYFLDDEGRTRWKTAVWEGSTTIVEYDEKQNPLGETTYAEDGSIVSWKEYDYDSEGGMLETYYRADGSVSIENRYNADGMVVGIVYYNEDGSVDRQYETVCDEQGRPVSHFSRGGDGSVLSRTEWVYDGNGNKVESVTYDGSGAYVCSTGYEYDAAGQLLRVTDFAENGAETIREEYAYDAAGNQIKQIVYNRDGNVERCEKNTYYADGKTAGNQLIEYDSGGSIRNWVERNYDEAGNEIAYINYKPDGGIDDRKESRYDEAGNRTECIWYQGADRVLSRQVTEYDETGRVLKEVDYGEDGEIESSYVFVHCPEECRGTGYTYDGEGNLTRQTEWTFDLLGNVLSRQSVLESWSYEYEYGLAGEL